MRKLKNSELNRKNIEEYRQCEKIPLVIVLDNIRSQNNIGSIFRTCDAFLVEEIILCGITAVPPHPEIHKTALGATESVKWRYIENTVDALRLLQESGYIPIAVEQAEGSSILGEFVPDTHSKYALVLGHEVHGVSQEVVDRCTHCLEIPQYGTKHSLNISICAGIVIWDFFCKMSQAN
jgi:23S rRNA (guanosine2251-2'-O)-methyltransferase